VTQINDFYGVAAFCRGQTITGFLPLQYIKTALNKNNRAH